MSATNALFAKSLQDQFPDLPWKQTQIYGPKIAIQVDHFGNPIQRYLTAVVRPLGDGFFFARQIIDLPDETPHPMTLTTVGPETALSWLAENGLAKAKLRDDRE